jgi:hypothetical protein
MREMFHVSLETNPFTWWSVICIKQQLQNTKFPGDYSYNAEKNENNQQIYLISF